MAFLEYAGDREYYLATACEKIYLLPSSPLHLTGVVSYEVFLRGTLDKIGAYPDFEHIGDYKTAPNAFTETTFTPAHREMAESLNRDAFEQLVQAIADSRKMSEREAEALIDSGPFLPEEALRAGCGRLVYEAGHRETRGGRRRQARGPGAVREAFRLVAGGEARSANSGSLRLWRHRVG